MKKIIAALAVLVAAMTGCSSVKDSTEYKRLATEVRTNEAEVTRLESVIKDLTVESLSLDTDLMKSTEQRRVLRESNGLALNDPATRARIIDEVLPSICANRGTVRFFTEGKVDISDDSWYDTAVSVGKYIGKPYVDLPNSVDDDKTNISEKAQAGFAAFESESSAPCNDEGQRSYQDAIRENCHGFTPLVLKKDPELHQGKCWVGQVEVVQFDSATGKCSFHGNIDGDYNVRAEFGVTLDPNSHGAATDCTWTSKIVEGMRIKFWGWGLGTFSYTTSNNSTMTIPSFKLMMWQQQ